MHPEPPRLRRLEKVAKPCPSISNQQFVHFDFKATCNVSYSAWEIPIAAAAIVECSVNSVYVKAQYMPFARFAWRDEEVVVATTAFCISVTRRTVVARDSIAQNSKLCDRGARRPRQVDARRPTATDDGLDRGRC